MPKCFTCGHDKKVHHQHKEAKRFRRGIPTRPATVGGCHQSCPCRKFVPTEVR